MRRTVFCSNCCHLQFTCVCDRALRCAFAEKYQQLTGTVQNIISRAQTHKTDDRSAVFSRRNIQHIYRNIFINNYNVHMQL